jgi:hypothetical protein
MIDTDNINNSDLFNYIVSIRGLKFKDKKILLHKVSVMDKTFKKNHLNFIDIMYDFNKSNSFVRIINNSQYVYDNGLKVLTQKRKKSKFFTILKSSKKVFYKFMIMDLETKDINGILIPYCVSIFDGSKAYSFYITDYKSFDEMLKESVLFILKKKYNGYRVYLHNFSYFDGIFLMKIISNLVSSDSIKPVIRDNRIINLKVIFNTDNSKRKYYVEFRDSYLLLTLFLEKLGKTFAINEGKLEQKLSFPYRFVNEPDVDYNYIGSIPFYQYYDKISEVEYNNLILSENKDNSK